MSIFEALLQHDRVPNFYRVENTRSAPKLEDVAAETRRVMQESGTLEQLKPGQSVCIAAGSREIANIALIVRTVCEVVREHGAEPFIIPAMGSHAGAQAEGQKKILADFGITEEYTGAPIRSSMETVQVGVTKPHGFPARIDRYAAEADWIIPIGRIKPHTDIRGPIQSGILKMIVIGMGKQFGADICHAEGFPSMSQNIVEIGLVNEIFYDPHHPYTWALLSSLPQLGHRGEDLYSIKGTPPNLFQEIHGDAFAPRNPHALTIDRIEQPPYFDVSPTHKARTWLLDPRAPKVEPPEAIRKLKQLGGNAVDNE